MKDIYLVCYGGGFGDQTWDAEQTVKAKNIREAYDKAVKIICDDESLMTDWGIFSIEQIN